MSQHAYFNLKGENGGSILDHYLTVDADSFTPNTPGFVPTGIIEPVAGGPLDFRSPHTFSERIDSPNEHMKLMGGYSANWVLNKPVDTFGEACEVYEPSTGRSIEVRTTEPGLLIYTGRGLPTPYTGLILETLHHPDTPNNPHFPSCVLRPGEEYLSITSYTFGVENKVSPS